MLICGITKERDRAPLWHPMTILTLLRAWPLAIHGEDTRWIVGGTDLCTIDFNHNQPPLQLSRPLLVLRHPAQQINQRPSQRDNQQILRRSSQRVYLRILRRSSQQVYLRILRRSSQQVYLRILRRPSQQVTRQILRHPSQQVNRHGVLLIARQRVQSSQRRHTQQI